MWLTSAASAAARPWCQTPPSYPGLRAFMLVGPPHGKRPGAAHAAYHAARALAATARLTACGPNDGSTTGCQSARRVFRKRADFQRRYQVLLVTPCVTEGTFGERRCFVCFASRCSWSSLPPLGIGRCQSAGTHSQHRCVERLISRRLSLGAKLTVSRRSRGDRLWQPTACRPDHLALHGRCSPHDGPLLGTLEALAPPPL